MVNLASTSMTVLENLRKNVENEFKKMFKEAQRMAEIMGIEISTKRIINRQKNRSNYLSSNNSLSPEDYYRVSICIPFIESFISQINERFLVHQNIFKGFQCLFDDTNSKDIKDFESLVSFYIPEVDTVTANCELQIWKQKLKGLVTNKNEMLPFNALDAIRCCDPIIFPNIFILLKILFCLPVSTSTPERSFSGLKRIKTYLRNSMKEDRLNGLVLLSYYRNVITPDELLNEMAKKPRKIDLVL